MGKENVVDQLDRDPHGDDVAHAAGAKVEKEVPAIAQLYKDAGAGLVLAHGLDGCATQERDSHLVGAEFLRPREIHVGVRDQGRRPVIGRQGKAAAGHAAVRVPGNARTGLLGGLRG